jgi:hypothetical protein
MSTRLCAGCGAPMPALTDFGRLRRRDAKYHNEKCGDAARYLNSLIAKAARPGGPELPDWARDAYIERRRVAR